MTLEHLNPQGLHRAPAFSQGVVAVGPGRLITVGGQNGVDAEGRLVQGGLYEQSAQALSNVLAVLAAAGADQRHVVRLAVYVKAGEDVRQGFLAAQEVWGQNPTALTVLAVAGFARPGVLVEVEALAFVPEGC